MYTEEKNAAKEFLEKYGDDPIVQETINEIKNQGYLHSDRWSIVFDMIYDHFPEYKGTKVATGLVYLVEDTLN